MQVGVIKMFVIKLIQLKDLGGHYLCNAQVLHQRVPFLVEAMLLQNF
jgi:hypothetical protein